MMTNANKPPRPSYFPPEIKISPQPERSNLDEGISNVVKAAKGLFSFLTAEDDQSFVEQIDAKHGTRLIDTYKRVGMARNVVGASSADEAIADPDELPNTVREPCLVCSVVHQGACPFGGLKSARAQAARGGAIDAHGEDVTDEEDDVVIVIDEPPPAAACSFCKGKPVAHLHRATGVKVAVACPTCKAPPKALRSRPLLKGSNSNE
jgi:hypothetical protein